MTVKVLRGISTSNVLQVVLARAAHRNPGDGHLTQIFMDFRNVDGS